MMEIELPVGENHALLIGMVAGLLATELEVEFIDFDGAHTDTIRVKRPSGTWLVSVKPERFIEP